MFVLFIVDASGCILVSNLVCFPLESWLLFHADDSDLLEDVLTVKASMGTPTTPSGGMSGEHRYPSPCNVEEYIRPHIPKRSARRLAKMSTGEAFAMRHSLEK